MVSIRRFLKRNNGLFLPKNIRKNLKSEWHKGCELYDFAKIHQHGDWICAVTNSETLLLWIYKSDYKDKTLWFCKNPCDDFKGFPHWKHFQFSDIVKWKYLGSD